MQEVLERIALVPLLVVVLSEEFAFHVVEGFVLLVELVFCLWCLLFFLFFGGMEAWNFVGVVLDEVVDYGFEALHVVLLFVLDVELFADVIDHRVEGWKCLEEELELSRCNFFFILRALLHDLKREEEPFEVVQNELNLRLFLIFFLGHLIAILHLCQSLQNVHDQVSPFEEHHGHKSERFFDEIDVWVVLQLPFRKEEDEVVDHQSVESVLEETIDFEDLQYISKDYRYAEKCGIVQSRDSFFFVQF